MSLLALILLIILVLLLIGATPVWPHSSSWGNGPSGVLVFLLILILILAIAGYI